MDENVLIWHFGVSKHLMNFFLEYEFTAPTIVKVQKKKKGRKPKKNENQVME